MVCHKAPIQNVYSVYYFKTCSMCIFNAVKKQSGLNFVLTHFKSQPMYVKEEMVQKTQKKKLFYNIIYMFIHIFLYIMHIYLIYI